MQYIYTMIGVSKIVPPKRQIIKDISLSFFPGAKIGLLGLNGAGKSTVLRIMAGVDTDFSGEARPQPGIKVGYLEQEPRARIPSTPCAKPSRKASASCCTRRPRSTRSTPPTPRKAPTSTSSPPSSSAWRRSSPPATRTRSSSQLEIAADALRLPPWDADRRQAVRRREAPRRAVPPAAVASRTCCCSTNRPTISTPNRSSGWNSS